MLVEYVQGDFLSVVGFPLNHFCKELGKIYNSSSESPTNKIKRKDSEMCDGPSTSINYLPEKTVQADISSFNNCDTTGPEGTKSNAEGFPHSIVELLDGFKASKVQCVSCLLFNKWPEYTVV